MTVPVLIMGSNEKMAKWHPSCSVFVSGRVLAGWCSISR